MIDRWIAEATECDFKVALEVKKPKSWLKSVSAFANGIGGTLFFGIDDNRNVIGLVDAQADAEAISRLIKERITPLPEFVLASMQEQGKNLLSLTVNSGSATPYFYKADGVTEAYIRIGNESVVAPDYMLRELILKGTNRTFDSLVTDSKKSDYSFTLLEATYLERAKLRFEKKAQYRVDKPDYSERAVTVALVNALIHRDYLVMGSEVHIDMYDDRLEIYSPGGMYRGKPIQECVLDEIDSVRRNPVIADLFHRMKFMERRGSGIRKILDETAKLPGYTDELKPTFHSTHSSFFVTLKIINYLSQSLSDQDTDQVVTKMILEFCVDPRSKREICEHLGFNNLTYFTRTYLNPLLEAGKLLRTIPDEPSSKNQKYVRSA